MLDAETLDRLAEAEAPVLSVYLSRPMQVNPLRPARRPAQADPREAAAGR